MLNERKVNLRALIRCNRRRVSATWCLVLVENLLLASIPLFIGLTIDGLQEGNIDDLVSLFVVLMLLTLISVARRVYDTRVYGSMKVELGLEVDRLNHALPLSVRSARLDMSRELVDFLEHQVPQLITSMTQIVVSLVVLTSFGGDLALSAMGVTVVMLLLYGCFRRTFYRLNQALNAQVERQVSLLERSSRFYLALPKHLSLLRRWEVKQSDAEAVLYGLIFAAISVFIVGNLWLAARLDGLTVGTIFSIVTYSWEYIGAALILPEALQGFTRLNEITARINNPQNALQ